MNSKKFISFICALSLTLTLSACGSTESGDTRSRETAATTAPNASQQSADGQGQTQQSESSESSDAAKDKLDEALGLKEQSPALSEDELKEKLEAEAGAAASKWYYDDYDGDGTKEAFGLIGKDENKIIAVYGVDSEGNVTLMRDSFWGTNYNAAFDSLVEYGGKKYFSVDTNCGASGAVSSVFSFKDGKPFELALSKSEELFGFYADEDGAFTREEGSWAHDRARVDLEYDEAAQDFTIASKPADSGEWKQAYIDYIDNTIAETFSDSSMFFEASQFAIIDIDGDDVPEIFYSVGSGMSGSGLLTYADGEVSELHGKSNDSIISYIEAGGVFKYFNSYVDSSIEDVYTISGGKPKLKLSAKSYLPYDPYSGTGDYEYYINDMQVPVGVYEKKLAAAFDQSSAKWALDGETYTYYSIASAIQGY